MGNSMNKHWDDYWINSPKCKMVLIGFDCAGKSSLLENLNLSKDIVPEIPIIGHHIEVIKKNKVEIVTWDVGGSDKIRKFFQIYSKDADVVVFVIDSHDTHRFEELKRVIDVEFSDITISDAIVLIFANKQDLPNAVSTGELVDKLELKSKIKQNWTIQPCSTKTGKGIVEGFNWIQNEMNKKKFNKMKKFDL